MGVLETLLILYAVVAFVMSGFQAWRDMVLGDTDGKLLNYFPKEIYERTKMNWFGVILVFIGEILIIPLYWLILIIAYIIFGIIYIFDWLIHVGRRKK